MTLSVSTFGNNAQVPGISAETYNPDQLIAGNLKQVTDTATITGGAALKRGSVLGQLLNDTAGAAVAGGGNTGNGTVTLITTGLKTVPGVYTIKLKSATTFDVINPNGVQLAEAAALGAYADAQLNFTITAGGTAFVAGDSFTITVSGSGKYKLAAAAATDGSETPATILADDADASGGDVPGGIYLMGEFNANALTLGAGITAAAAKAALAPNGIFIKTNAVSAADPT